ncbi:efflux RND transporter permease subunit [Chryseolinea sp. T2]|uniref:efflux RND transporter permease subunit n=1 Tax=Chryseolinea sp. T2 TaxID=3129255 RepID=UPI00307771C1
MNLIRLALRKPISIVVLVAGLLFFGIGAVRTIKIDIFPAMDLPVIYLSHPFGGYTPSQMEAYFAKQYVNIFLYVNGLKSIETRNLQGLTLMKLTFYPGTNMAGAQAEVSAFGNRLQAVFPPGSQPPFIIRFDASTLPIGQLVISSETRSNNQLLDLANTYVRSSFTSIPGLVSPAPFGGNVRTIVIKADPELLRSHNLTPDQIVEAIRINNQTSPSGSMKIGDINYLTPTNTQIRTLKEFERIPLFKGGVQNLYLGDVATVEDGADITMGYAQVNGKRSIYLNIAKSADASTWEVVQTLKKNLPRFQAQLPEDVKLSYEFDQSTYVINAVKSLISEGAIGAILTGLMVLLFLKDVRGALIVILTIPTSIISGILFLQLFGQTINIMTLSGLALAIGILVDESTVTIENIHQHFDLGKPKALAIWDACKEIAFPKLLILFCILAVFAPALTMKGIPGSLFFPLSLAIAFSMITSYLLSQTFVPVMANWIMKPHKRKESDHQIQAPAHHHETSDTWDDKKLLVEGKADTPFEKFRQRFMRMLERLMSVRKPVVILYSLLTIALAVTLLLNIGRDVLPEVRSGQFQVRLKAREGLRVERTEEMLIKALGYMEDMVGKENIAVTSAYVGQHPGLFSTSPIYLFMGGPHEALLQVSLKPEFHVDIDQFKDDFRKMMSEKLPGIKVSFEPIALTERILAQGAATPVEIRIASRNKKNNERMALQLVEKLKGISYMRDVQIAQSIRYPSLKIEIDRLRAAQLGVDVTDISRSLVASTSSSRYTDKNVWLDEASGLSYGVQVQVPENQMNTLDDLAEIPVQRNMSRPVLSDVATFTYDTTYGRNDDLGAVPIVSVTANLYDMDLGTATDEVKRVIASLGELPRGMVIEPIGLGLVLGETLESLQSGLVVAVVVIFLMLAANFQSFKVSLVILATVPAVISGALISLLLTGSTLNLQSYMGIIMSVGVSIANAVLLITNAEELRRHNGDALLSAREAAALRLRPILMTSVAMITGMMPMAIGHGEGGDQAAPLARAVIGGLFFSTFAVIILLPLVFAWVQEKTSTVSVSLDPEDKESKYYVE